MAVALTKISKEKLTLKKWLDISKSGEDLGQDQFANYVSENLSRRQAKRWYDNLSIKAGPPPSSKESTKNATTGVKKPAEVVAKQKQRIAGLLWSVSDKEKEKAKAPGKGKGKKKTPGKEPSEVLAEISEAKNKSKEERRDLLKEVQTIVTSA